MAYYEAIEISGVLNKKLAQFMEDGGYKTPTKAINALLNAYNEREAEVTEEEYTEVEASQPSSNPDLMELINVSSQAAKNFAEASRATQMECDRWREIALNDPDHNKIQYQAKKINELTARVEHLNSETKNQKETIKGLNENLSMSTSQMNELEAEKKSLAGEVEELKLKQMELESEMSDRVAGSRTMQADIVRLETELEKVRSELSEAQEKLTQVEASEAISEVDMAAQSDVSSQADADAVH